MSRPLQAIRAATCYSAILIAMASGAQAQFINNSNGNVSNGNTVTAGNDGALSNVTTTFDSITLDVKRLLPEPGQKDGFRLVFVVSNSGGDDKRLTWMSPALTLIDELGNVYKSTETVGVPYCQFDNIKNCDSPQYAARLAPGVPITAAVKFSPKSGFSAELAALSNSVTFHARMVYGPDDFSNAQATDIVVTNIPIPR